MSDVPVYPLSGDGVKCGPQRGPRQVLGPYGRTCAPTHHLRERRAYSDATWYKPYNGWLYKPSKIISVQGYLAHKKTHPPLGSPYGPMHRPTVGS